MAAASSSVSSDRTWRGDHKRRRRSVSFSAHTARYVDTVQAPWCRKGRAKRTRPTVIPWGIPDRVIANSAWHSHIKFNCDSQQRGKYDSQGHGNTLFSHLLLFIVSSYNSYKIYGINLFHVNVIYGFPLKMVDVYTLQLSVKAKPVSNHTSIYVFRFRLTKQKQRGKTNTQYLLTALYFI